METIEDEQTQDTTTACAALIAVSTAFIIVRSWSRLKVQRNIGLDDGLILLSWIYMVAEAGLIITAANYGLGHADDEISPENYKLYLKLQLCAAVSYAWASCFAKMSFAVLYLRLFTSRGLILLNHGLIFFLFTQIIAETCVPIFRCTPIAKAWDPDLDGSCLDPSKEWYISTVINILEALVLFIQPIPTVWKLKLPLPKRLGIIFMLSLGLMVIAIVCIRLRYLTLTLDNTHDIAEPLIWSVVEVTTLIVCSCLPAVRHVVSTIPVLNEALGLEPPELPELDGYQRPGKNDYSFSLTSRRRRLRYVESQKMKASSLPRSSRESDDHMRLKPTPSRHRPMSDASLMTDTVPEQADRHGSIYYTRVPVPDLEAGPGHTAEIIIGMPASVLRREGTRRLSRHNIRYYSPRPPR